MPLQRTATYDGHGHGIARAMLQAGIAEPVDWKYAQGSALEFIGLTIGRWMREAGGESLRTHYNYHLALVEELGNWTSDAHGPFVVLENHECRGVACAAAFAELERVHPALPRTFYDLVERAVYRVGHSYDWYSTARLNEWRAEQEWEMDADEQALDAGASPDAKWLRERAIALVPPCMLVKPLGRRRTEALLRTLPAGSRAHVLMTAAVACYHVARQLPTRSIPVEIGFYDATEPVPMVVYHLTPNDDILGCFDEEEADHFNSGIQRAPLTVLPVDIASASALRTLRKRVRLMVELLVRLDCIADLIEGVGDGAYEGRIPAGDPLSLILGAAPAPAVLERVMVTV